jgi:hypothetical protein
VLLSSPYDNNLIIGHNKYHIFINRDGSVIKIDPLREIKTLIILENEFLAIIEMDAYDNKNDIISIYDINSLKCVHLIDNIISMKKGCIDIYNKF